MVETKRREVQLPDGLIAAAFSFAVGAAATVYAWLRMDDTRLFSEGGHAYYLARFPFRTVLIATDLGTIASTIAMIRDRSAGRRTMAAFAFVLNVCWAAYFGKQYLRI
jgi:hypothetical protein